jgi:hypothetical protein
MMHVRSVLDPVSQVTFDNIQYTRQFCYTTNRPVLFLEGVRPRGARRSRNFLHYSVWGKGGNLGTFFTIQFGERGAPGAPWGRKFLTAGRVAVNGRGSIQAGQLV